MVEDFPSLTGFGLTVARLVNLMSRYSSYARLPFRCDGSFGVRRHQSTEVSATYSPYTKLARSRTPARVHYSQRGFASPSQDARLAECLTGASKKEILSETVKVSIQQMTQVVVKVEELLEIDPAGQRHLSCEEMKRLFFAMREIEMVALENDCSNGSWW